ncbi:MAG TPA: efflux transporter outer membrane subunit [Steroidobacteraceae bacterium]|nr:efflux transporter outer membrane subunit [Steroidobacteraceae bacterium]
MAERMRAATMVFGTMVFGLCIAAACSLEPRYREPAPPVADVWPIPATTPAGKETAAADIGWRDFFVDQRLQALIAQALANNRDLRIAVLNVERARAMYRIQRAQRLPNVAASGVYTKQNIPSALSDGVPPSTYQSYEVSLGVAAFELDLFGRVNSLTRAALEQYLAEEDTRRSAQLSLIAEVAQAYLTLASDRELARLAADTLKSQQGSFALTQRLHETGAASGLDLAQARTTVESARADAARYEGDVAQDIDALTLLLGVTPDPETLPQGLDVELASLSAPPAGLPSSVLLRRPDVRANEHLLRAANANIGAARAAFFPTISLVGNIGSASVELSGLFKSGTEAWTFAPQVTLPIFAGGALAANLDAARTDQLIALAQYEKSIQSGFREVADALALSDTLVRERNADEALTEATLSAYEISQKRYRAGRDSYLNVLDSQRSDYAAKQRLIAVRLAEQSNRVTLYKALGGGWLERSR